MRKVLSLHQMVHSNVFLVVLVMNQTQHVLNVSSVTLEKHHQTVLLVNVVPQQLSLLLLVLLVVILATVDLKPMTHVMPV